ncbi:hypothetical protein [Rhizobium sp. BK176]|uniref:hypothetical protein n=1 Tax=Rhizobium sp. BK176 TaxID=2587071 RepID=UPI00216781A5|nr:hypothetical protein [Rhizobium sp. BK176]MCS4094035.1 hypothetical protein [Rhizobium sp. BK176]
MGERLRTTGSVAGQMLIINSNEGNASSQKKRRATDDPSDFAAATASPGWLRRFIATVCRASLTICILLQFRPDQEEFPS